MRKNPTLPSRTSCGIRSATLRVFSCRVHRGSTTNQWCPVGKKSFESGRSWHSICHSPRIRCSIGVSLLIIHQSSNKKKGNQVQPVCSILIAGWFWRVCSQISLLNPLASRSMAHSFGNWAGRIRRSRSSFLANRAAFGIRLFDSPNWVQEWRGPAYSYAALTVLS